MKKSHARPSHGHGTAAGCAHNPTGIDPTKDQWNEIADLCIKKAHIPFFDVAYQGFATGSLEEDAFAPRFFVDKGLECFVSQSYSKNLGLYAERIGAISCVCEDKENATRCATQQPASVHTVIVHTVIHSNCSQEEHNVTLRTS